MVVVSVQQLCCSRMLVTFVADKVLPLSYWCLGIGRVVHSLQLFSRSAGDFRLLLIGVI